MTTNNSVLVISDKPQQFDMAVARLRRDGYRVHFEKDPIESLNLARNETPRLIISELAVPDIDGLELCLNIRNSGRLRSTPILLIGDLSKGSSIVSDGLRCGATDYLERPFDGEELSAICSEMVKTQAEPYEKSQAENLFDSLIENISDAITIVNQEGIFLFASPSTKNFLLGDPTELLGKCMFDLVHPADVGETREYINAVQWLTGLATNPISYRIRQTNGSWKLIEAIARPINDPRFGSAIVITSREQHVSSPSLDSAMSSELLRRAIFDRSPLALAIFSASGHFIEGNPALLSKLDISRSGLRNMALSEFIFPSNGNTDRQAIGELFIGRRTAYEFDNGYLSPAGERVWGRIALVLCSGRNGASDFLMGIFDDPGEHLKAPSLQKQKRINSVLNFSDWKINKSLVSDN